MLHRAAGVTHGHSEQKENTALVRALALTPGSLADELHCLGRMPESRFPHLYTGYNRTDLLGV